RLPRLVAETPIDKTVKVTVWRKRKEHVLEVKVGELEENEEQAALTPGSEKEKTPPSTVNALGLSLSAATPELRQRFSLADDVSGVVVTEVASDSPAAEKGIRPGDVVVEAAQEEVKDPAQV